MRLVHYGSGPVTGVHSVKQEGGRAARGFKPNGFWVSDDDDEQSWPKWCRDEDYGIGSLTHVHDVTLARDARIRFLSSPADIDLFTHLYGQPLYPGGRAHSAINWSRLATECQGIIITPYIWGRRLDGDADWYYARDCASGCIWDAAAVASIALREIATDRREVAA